MHITFNGWFWDQPCTGSGQYLRYLLAALAALAPEHRLSLVVPDTMHRLDHLPPDVDVLPVQMRFGGHLGKVWFEQRQFPRAATHLKADIAHVPYWGPPFSAPVPLVCSVLDMIPLAVPAYRTGIRNRLYTSLVTAAAKGASHILTISEASKQDMIRRIGIPEECISVTHLAVDPVFCPTPNHERDRMVRDRYHLPEDFVLYLGSYAVHKNIRLLLAAYTYVVQGLGKAVPLILAGQTPSTWGTPRFPDLPAAIEELGLADSVRWLGPVDEADKPSLYRLARVSVFPSYYEGFGLGLLEAMASGTPVVACAVSSVPEVVGEAAFLVAPDDAQAMGGAILSIVLQADMAETLRSRGLTRAQTFSWQQTAADTLAVYQQLLS
jgi:glycosyltransferase involved in cell wall biosynthesis